MYRPSPVLLCAVVIVLMITAGCTFLNPSKTGANPLVPDTPAPVSPAATTQPGAPDTQASGTCPADTSSDAANCGGCGNACPANALCQAGQCYCQAGYTADANNQCIPAPAGTGTGNGCPAGMNPCPDGNCYDLTSTASNCGMCGNQCPTGMVCSGSTCTSVPADTITAAVTTGTTTPATTSSVGPGLTYVGPVFGVNCAILGKTSCSGTCVNTSIDTANCGSCGHVCKSLAPSCCGGTCVNFLTDSTNCGKCGNKCNVYSTCVSGGCSPKAVTMISVMPTVKITQPLYKPVLNYNIPVGP